ncbi:MAG: hypothetical protein WEE89_19915, partial [Gemmatimonadota bacterium]
GALFRRVAASAMRIGSLRPVTVSTTVIVGAALSIALRTSPRRSLLWIPYVAGVAIAITCFRASYDAGDTDAKYRLRWIARGGLAALGLFVAAGLAGLRSGPTGAVGVFILLTLAPGAILLGLGLGVLQRRRSENVAPEGS